MNVFITGASRGIGLGLVEAYLRRGDHVVAAAREPEAADGLQALHKERSDRLRLTRLDVCDAHSCRAWGRSLRDAPPDVLINNAGLGESDAALPNLDFAAAAVLFETNACGPLRVVQALWPPLQRRGVKIVNISSKMGSIGDNQQGGRILYRMSKAALNMATRNLALELQPSGAVVLCVHPGWVQTRMGGTGAPLAVADSVAGIVRVVDGATAAHSGNFFNYDGQPLPW